ncbi:acyltransferase family protein [Hyphomonas sp.]|uniref:acyltransferase family protein n=1 Tax=Hyphomonas sp. TaxID=87 RepID=UPI003527AC79
MTARDQYIVPIDGLRAIAVMAVLLFHVDISFARGGFAGVDVFFVISGFLITRNILRESESSEGWSASRFYLRRIARLFPALFLTIAATLVAAWWVLSPADLARLGRTAIMAILSAGNIFFWLESGYFDTSAATKPLLHTWSLAVEEQFYLVWPAFLLLLGMAGTWGRRAGIVIVGALSLFAALWFMPKDSAAVFFLMPFRMHQFALGAILAATMLLPRNALSSLVCVLGVAGIVAVTVIADGEKPDYLLNAVAPALAAMAVIASSRSWVAEKLLGSAVPVWIGQRSYSIYLAHWPIIVLWKMKTDYMFSASEKLIAILLAIVAGTLLHMLIEKPFRFRSHQSPKFRGGVLAGVVGLSVASLTIGAHYWGLQGVPSRQPAAIAALSGSMDDQWAARRKLVKHDICSFPIKTIVASNYQQDVCSNPPAQGRAYLIVGDSFANDAYMILSKAYPEIYFGQAAVPGCWLRLPKQFADGEQEECRKLYSLALEELIRNKNYDGIVLASNWQDGHYYRIRDMINYLKPLNKDIYVVGQRTRFRERLPTIMSTELSLDAGVRKAQGMVLDKERMINDKINEMFSDQAVLLDFFALQCPDKCLITDEKGELLYMDDAHISIPGANLFAKRLREQRPVF